MIPEWFTVVSVCIRLYSGGQYAWGVLNGKARPNPITWFLWGLTPLITFVAGLQYGWRPQSIVLLALAASPLVVCVTALVKHNPREHFTRFSITCGILALAGILLWQITSLPELAIIFSILADIFATLPTLHKAYRDPSSEYALPYFLSVVSMAITLLTIRQWLFAVYAFPLYMFAINVLLWTFVVVPFRKLLAPKRGYESMPNGRG